MSTTMTATVNGVALADPAEAVDTSALRQRAHLELLRQAAIRAGLLNAADAPPVQGVPSSAAADAIEAWLERELPSAAPDEATCRRHHAAQAARYATGERVHLRHLLFAVTPGVPLNALRQRAEACLIELRARSRDEAPGRDDRFARTAAELSNCPSATQGGDLGWLGADDCAPEFARAIFGRSEVGVLPQLVHSRFGLHVVEVLARQPGCVPPFEAVQGAVQRELAQQQFAAALRQTLQTLAGAANVAGVEFDDAAAALVQ
jgi:peptidyl-prolyl cis-trans isomerase C